MIRLIGDIGATGSTWAIVHEGLEPRFFSAPGYNPISQSEFQLRELIHVILKEIDPSSDYSIWYYGAGAGNASMTQGIRRVFTSNLSVISLEIGSDLLAAGRALCQDKPGVVAILGTGSNVGWYDGRDIVSQAASLGYPIGDEGSGTDLGKRLVRALYYNMLPAEIATSCHSVLPGDRFEFLRLLRESPAPNRLLANLTRIIAQHRDHPWTQGILHDAFREFTGIHLRNQKKHEKINFVGSIAFYFCDELEEVLKEYHLDMGEVVREPIASLVDYHRNQRNNE